MVVTGITQARIGSSRLPGKVLLPVTGSRTILDLHLERISRSKSVSGWIVATTHEPGVEKILEIAAEHTIACYQGDLPDVLDRFYQAQRPISSDYIVRVTSDCPLIDPAIIDQTVNYCINEQLDYFSSVDESPFPDGTDVEVFSRQLLEKAWKNATSVSDREHVTPWIRRAAGVKKWPFPSADYSHLRITIDEPEDYLVIRELVAKFGSDEPVETYCSYLAANPQVAVNQHHFRNAGFMKSKLDDIRLRTISNFAASDAYRDEIHDLIPGGSHTYSKGDDQFPEQSPAAITHGKAAHVWDPDGNEYLDCSMGLTSVSLGHAYEPVVNAVAKELKNGVNFQRPATIERDIAKKFLGLVPMHDMIKFAKNGSVVTTAAVKLARAKTGRSLVAFPAEHPFYSYDDWFIGSTPCDAGIPSAATNFSVTFKACDIASLKALFEQYPGQIACIITEPEKLTCDENCACKGRPDEFLRAAIELAHTDGALFIIDEMITGFKTDFPGSITKYNLEPDMATWGKGIANGFSFCALTGKKEVMELGGIRNEGAEKVFLISTTHGGETHAIAAALETIDIFQQENVSASSRKKGDELIGLCRMILEQKGRSIDLIPCNWMVGFAFKDAAGKASAEYRTLFLQEMIRRGVLFQGIFVPCHSHTSDDLFYFAKAFSESIDVYNKALDEGVDKYLVGKPVKAVFRKYL